MTQDTNTAIVAEEIAAAICKSVAELPDRNSPADWPEAMLVTHDELRQITIAALASAAAPQPDTAYAALPDVDALAQEIRRVDGGHNLGAGALAEALMPFLRASHGQAPAEQPAPSAAAVGKWSLGEIDGNWRDIDLPDHGAVMRIIWRMEDDTGRNEKLEAQAHAVIAALNAPQPSPTPQADSQPAPLPAYPPLPEPMGSIQLTAHGPSMDVYDATDMRAFADATHALRRIPAPVGVEPAQWQKRHQLRTNGEWENTNEHDAKWWRDNSQGWEIRALYTTPQPTQAQAGAVPLTCEWTHNEDDGFWDTECGQSWQFDDGGPKENNMHFCHHCGKPMHIKGGQHAD